MLFFLFIENYLGERPLAVANIVRSFYMILTIPANALSATTNTLVSNTIGAGRIDEVFSLVKRISRMSFAIIVVVALCVAIFPKAVIAIYTNDPSLIDDTVIPLYVLLSALPFYSVGGALFSAVSGTGNTRYGIVFRIGNDDFLCFVHVAHHRAFAIVRCDCLDYGTSLLDFSADYVIRLFKKWKMEKQANLRKTVHSFIYLYCRKRICLC